jgi:hypothetical protein
MCVSLTILAYFSHNLQRLFDFNTAPDTLKLPLTLLAKQYSRAVRAQGIGDQGRTRTGGLNPTAFPDKPSIQALFKLWVESW